MAKTLDERLAAERANKKRIRKINEDFRHAHQQAAMTIYGAAAFGTEIRVFPCTKEAGARLEPHYDQPIATYPNTAKGNRDALAHTQRLNGMLEGMTAMTRKQLVDRAAWEIASAIEFDSSPTAAAETVAMLERRAAGEPADLIRNDNAVRDLYPLTDEERTEIIRRAEQRAYA
jgi:hypothetical protein